MPDGVQAVVSSAAVLCVNSFLSSVDMYTPTISRQLSPAIEECKICFLPLPLEQIKGWIYSVIFKGLLL